jgi:hypothetical protein
MRRVITRIILISMKPMAVLAKNKGLLVLMTVAVAFVGCSRCQECTVNNNTETICDTEFDSSQQYEEAIADREAAGATCTSSGGF